MASNRWNWNALAWVGALMLSGCASQAVAPLADGQLWQDAAFPADSTLVTETPASIFALDADLLASLRATVPATAQPAEKIQALLAHLYGPQGIRLEYRSGHSTGAMQTWRNQEGDCLSLTILAYAAARALGLPARMQEVAVPPVIDRREGVDYAVGHVNVIIPLRSAVVLNGRTFETGFLLIDFEPQAASARRGDALSEEAVLARFYNNKAAEYWVQGEDARAYAYFKAALQADATYGPAYGNLALLYARHGLLQPAEALLRYAVTLSDAMDGPLRSLHRLLLAQGRTAEAEALEVQIHARQVRDPYYWLAQGQHLLLQGDYSGAVQALERAQALSSGFVEVHAHLALAYWRAGQRQQAQVQIQQLQGLQRGEGMLALLNKKIAAAP